MRVLVVDDSPGVRRRLVGLLREAALDVIEADGAELAVVLAAREQPDAIILDILLPGRQGLDVLPALRAGAPGALVVILTNAPWYRRHCLALGAHHVLDKSSEFDQVVAILTAGYKSTA